MIKKAVCFAFGALLLALSVPVEAQQKGKVLRIGFLLPRTTLPEEFRQRLRELGYVEGKNIIIEPRFAEGHFDRFPGKAVV